MKVLVFPHMGASENREGRQELTEVSNKESCVLAADTSIETLLPVPDAEQLESKPRLELPIVQCRHGYTS